MAGVITRINLRNDSTANWLANSSAILSKGEIGIEFLTSGKTKLKIGNGATSWSELAYFNSGVEFEAIDTNVLVLNNNNNLSLLGFEEAEIGTTPIKGENGQIIWIKDEESKLVEEVNNLTQIVNNKVDIVYSIIDEVKVPWTLLSPENKQKLETIEPKAQENRIEAICLAGTGKCLAIIDKTVQLPFATSSMPGLVKLSKEIVMNDQQALTIKEVNINKVVQTAGEEIHLYCGNANI